MRLFWLLHNLRAGRPSVRQGVALAAESLARCGVEVRVEAAEGTDELRAAARRAVAAGAEAVLAAGGDGTLGAIAAELAGTPVALGGLPAGTANVWARELRLPLPSPLRPRALAQAAVLLAGSPAYPTDLGRANGRYFLAWAGIGLDAFATQQYEARRGRSRLLGGYLYNTLLTLKVAGGFRPVDLRLEVSGLAGTQALEGRFAMVTAANIGLHGGGWVRLAGDARLDDGLVDVWAFRAGSRRELLSQIGWALGGRRRPHPGIHRLTGDHIEIYTAAPQVIHLDAEPQPPTQRLSIRVAARSLRVLVPPAAQHLYMAS